MFTGREAETVGLLFPAKSANSSICWTKDIGHLLEHNKIIFGFIDSETILGFLIARVGNPLILF